MKSIELLEAFGYIEDQYILDAGNLQAQASAAKRNSHKHSVRNKIAAVIALILACFLLCQIPKVVSAIEMVKEQIAKFFESMYPPKEITVSPEGFTEIIPHEAVGVLPEAGRPGFIMYIDKENYQMIEENGAYYIRGCPVEFDREEIRSSNSALLKDLSPEEQEAFIDKRIEEMKAFYASLPPVEIEIRYIPGKDSLSCAQETLAELADSWDMHTEIQEMSRLPGYGFDLKSAPVSFEVPFEWHYFFSYGEQGTFHLINRHYLESDAAGYRFSKMIQTFTILNGK